jgi:two-component system sensor histidine kinase MtrB
LSTDPRRIDRVVGNLVDNAFRHGALPVTVTLRETLEEVVIEVADGGEGIPADQVQRLFEPFYKRDPSRRGPGSGLGLAIAAEHTRLLGGRITVTSEVGRGMSFSLVLPRGDPATAGGDVSDGDGAAEGW